MSENKKKTKAEEVTKTKSENITKPDVESKSPVTMEELRAAAEKAADKYNELMVNGKMTEAAPYEAMITKYVNDYTAAAQKKAFVEILATSDPMLEAVKRATFDTIRARGFKADCKTANIKVGQKTIENAERYINISALNKEKAIGHDPNWENMYKHIVYLLTKRAAAAIESKQDLSDYDIKEKALKAPVGATDVVSNNALMKALQSLTKAMIGEKLDEDGNDAYKIMSKHRNYLLMGFTRSGRMVGDIAVVNEANARNLIVGMLNRLVNQTDFTVSGYKQKKK